MSYIGRGIDSIDNISTLDNLSFNGSLQTFNLTQNSVAFVPVSADALQIQIDGVIQSGNYTVSGSTVTFDFTPSGSSVCNGIRHFGVGIITQPSDGSVNMAQLGASGTKSSSTFLAGDNSFKTVSGTTINTNADNRVITGSGTANTLNGEANLTFDGTSLTANKVILTNSSGLTGGASSDGFITNADDTNTGIVFPDSDRIQFWTGDNERLRIASDGKVLINTTADLGNVQGVLHVKGKSNNNIARFGAGTNGEGIAFVNQDNGQVGGITLNASATVYNTSSDYRLKENVDYTWDATTRLKQLKPARFNWIVDSNNTLLDGFLAHEVSSVVPEAITGTKDQLEKNEDGTNKLDDDENTIPKHQGIDQSKLVPLLTKALQEAIIKIETLEAKVTALENA